METKTPPMPQCVRPINMRALDRFNNDARFNYLCSQIISNKFTKEDVLLAYHVVSEFSKRKQIDQKDATNTITSKDGLLWRNGVAILNLDEANIIAMDLGFTCAEELVKHLNNEFVKT